MWIIRSTAWYTSSFGNERLPKCPSFNMDCCPADIDEITTVPAAASSVRSGAGGRERGDRTAEYARYNAGRKLKRGAETVEEESIRRQKQREWKAQQRAQKRASAANLEIKVVRPLAAEGIEVSTAVEMVTPFTITIYHSINIFVEICNCT